MKKSIILLVTTLILFTAVLAFARGSGEDGVIKIKIASMQGEGTPETNSIFHFQKLIEERSGRKIKVEVYPNMQLGNSETYIDSTRQGNIEMCVPGTELSVHQPMVALPEMPFLFRDWDHVIKTLNDPYVFEQLTKGIVEKVGLRPLGVNSAGFRVVTSNVPIKKMSDFKNIRLRVPNIPLYIQWGKGIGANAIALPMSELFTSLEQKVADAQENPFAVIQMMKYYEVQKYITVTNHILTTHGWYINEKFWQTLSEENQEMIQQAVKDSIQFCFDDELRAEKEAGDFFIEEGLELIYPDETFKKEMIVSQTQVYEWYYKTYPGSKELETYIRAIK